MKLKMNIKNYMMLWFCYKRIWS